MTKLQHLLMLLIYAFVIVILINSYFEKKTLGKFKETLPLLCNDSLILCNDLPVKFTNGTKWQSIDSSGDYFVYSAFLIGDELKVLGIKRAKRHRQAFCQITYTNPDTKTITVSVKVKEELEIPYFSFAKYTGVTFVCDKIRPCQSSSSLKYVSLVFENCSKSNVSLNIKFETQERSKFTVCVRPFFNLKDQFQIIEWIEFTRMMGASKIVFYDNGGNEDVVKIFKFYNKIGLVDIFGWKLPITSIQNRGQEPALHDCFYRNMNSGYIIHIDVDEFLTPQLHDDWSKMIELLEFKYSKNASFVVRNAFFSMKYSTDNETYTGIEKSRQYKMKSLLKFKHAPIFKETRRGKIIINPRFVKRPGVHFILELANNGSQIFVSPKYVLLHHYRFSIANLGIPDIREVVSKTNRRMLFFKDTLIKRVQTVVEEINVTDSIYV